MLEPNFHKLTPSQVAILKRGGAKKAEDEFDDVDEDDEVEVAETTTDGSSLPKRNRKYRPPAERMESRFVNLVDFMQQVPKKGDFDVKKIKKSLYFFS